MALGLNVSLLLPTNKRKHDYNFKMSLNIQSKIEYFIFLSMSLLEIYNKLMIKQLKYILSYKMNGILAFEIMPTLFKTRINFLYSFLILIFIMFYLETSLHTQKA